jgi:hypothetical protein
MELAEAHGELESAQILRGNAFVYDLVFEATLVGIPKAVAQLLNTRTAQYLESKQANPVHFDYPSSEVRDRDQVWPLSLFPKPTYN